MKKFLKMTALLFCLLVVVLMLGIVILVTVVNPNRFKPVVVSQVMKYTGRQLTINGDLSWTFFPSIGVSMGRATLSNPTGFGQGNFAEIGSATISVELMPLLRGRVKSSGMIIKDMRLQLIKTAQGETNWSFPVTKSADNTEATRTPGTGRNITLGLLVSGIDISNSQLLFKDEMANHQYQISHFSFKARNVNMITPFPINTSFNFKSNGSITGNADISSQLSFNVDKQIYSLRDVDLNAKFQGQNHKKITTHFKGNLIANLQDATLQSNEITGNLANINTTGSINIVDLTTIPKLKGNLRLLPFDLKQTIADLGFVAPDLQSAKNTTGDIDFTANKDGFNATGKFSINQMTVMKLNLTDFQTNMDFKNHILTLSPFTANFYQGKINGVAKIDLANAVPSFSVDTKVTNIQTLPLIKDLGTNQKLKIVSTGNIDLQLTTRGQTPEGLINNLNGSAKMNFANGYIEGIDVAFLIDNAKALLGRRNSNATDSNKTEFASLVASAEIKNGIIMNKDLHLDSPRFDTTGNGVIDLPNRKIQYSLQTKVKQNGSQKNDLSNLYGVSIPIMIAGNLDHPKIGLDANLLLASIAKRELEKATDKVQDQIKKQLPGKASDLLQGIFGN